MEFGPLTIEYEDSVIEPRPWTLAQSRIAASFAGGLAPGPILELCCGPGQIGLAAAAWTHRRIILVDDDPAACRLAQHNARRNDIEAEVHCVPVERLRVARVPLVIADPPYLPRSVARKSADPVHAVDGGPDGLGMVASVLRAGSRAVTGTGLVVCQLGAPTQVDAVAHDISPLVGLRVIEAHRFGPDRSVVVLRPTARDRTSWSVP